MNILEYIFAKHVALGVQTKIDHPQVCCVLIASVITLGGRVRIPDSRGLLFFAHFFNAIFFLLRGVSFLGPSIGQPLGHKTLGSL